MKKFMLLAAAAMMSGIVFMLLFLGAIAQKTSEPIAAPTTIDHATEYYEIAHEAGAPWDLAMLIDTFVCDAQRKKNLEGNPLISSLNLMHVDVRTTTTMASGTESTHTSVHKGADAIFNLLNLDENTSIAKIFEAMETYEIMHSSPGTAYTPKVRCELSLSVVDPSEYKSTITAFYGNILSDKAIDDMLRLYETKYLYMLYFGSDSLNGGSNGTHARIAELIANDDTPFVGGDYVSPIDGSWRAFVTCEFGTGYAGHTGMDIGIPLGTEIKAVADGKVLYTAISTKGYGNHVVIHHGGGIVTLYAHCSELLVSDGQDVNQGQVIALSGNSGNSTGPHLHLEFIINGEPRDARSYLP